MTAHDAKPSDALTEENAALKEQLANLTAAFKKLLAELDYWKARNEEKHGLLESLRVEIENARLVAKPIIKALMGSINVLHDAYHRVYEAPLIQQPPTARVLVEGPDGLVRLCHLGTLRELFKGMMKPAIYGNTGVNGVVLESNRRIPRKALADLWRMSRETTPGLPPTIETVSRPAGIVLAGAGSVDMVIPLRIETCPAYVICELRSCSGCPYMPPCPYCDGEGENERGTKCGQCHGEGRMRANAKSVRGCLHPKLRRRETV